MKKILTVLLGALMLVMGLSLCASAADGFSIISAADHAIGESGVAIYISDIPEGTEKIVFTINGVDCEPTLESPYVATIGYGLNEIYATAYGMDDELYAVTNTIEIYGLDYEDFSTIKMYDFDTSNVDVHRIDGTEGGGDKSKIVSQKLNIAPPSDDPEKPNPPQYVAHLKSENPFNGWQAYRADFVYTRTSFLTAYNQGRDTVAYTFDIMPISVDKDSSLTSVRYNNDTYAFTPFYYKTDGTIQVATSLGASYSNPDITPIIDAPKNEWISFKVIMDSENELIILVADGVVYSSFGFDSTSEAARLNFQSTCTKTYVTFIVEANGMGAEGLCNEFYVDNFGYLSSNYIKRYEVTASTVTQDDESEGLDFFPLSGGKIKLEFSEEMAEIKKEDIVLEVNGDAISFDLAFDSDTNTAIITPLYTFIGRENCELSFENVKTAKGAPAQKTPSIEFTSALPPCAIADCTAGEIVSGENTEFSVTVRNTLPDDKDAMVLIGLYKDGGLESVIARDAFCPTDEDTDFSAMLYIPEDYDTFGYKIVAYLMYKDSFYIIDSFEYQV